MVKIGERCHIYDSAFIDQDGDLEIGDQVYVGKEVVIINHDHDLSKDGNWRDEIGRKLVIGDRAYLGYRSMILPQVNKIGEGAVIGAGSVITKDVGDWEVWAGNPAKKIGMRK